jgi:hypothetical protein
VLQGTPQLRRHPVYIVLQIHCKIENKYTRGPFHKNYNSQMTITNRQICWICQKFRFINIQLTNTIYKRQTTNDNCHWIKY